jgi:hypothetical protein
VEGRQLGGTGKRVTSGSSYPFLPPSLPPSPPLGISRSSSPEPGTLLQLRRIRFLFSAVTRESCCRALMPPIPGSCRDNPTNRPSYTSGRDVASHPLPLSRSLYFYPPPPNILIWPLFISQLLSLSLSPKCEFA